MQAYSAFGGVLASSIEFPELPVADVAPSSADWTVERSLERPRIDGLNLVGADPVAPGSVVRLFQDGDRYLVDYGPLGTFDILEGGRTILWNPGVHDCEDCARQCILGRVLALAIHARGGFCLHASCVKIGGEAVGFMAPKGTGKSTLASALLARGNPLVTDDMLRVEATSGPRAYQGVQRLRLWADSAASANEAGLHSFQPATGKHVTMLTLDPVTSAESVKLGAFYILSPEEMAEGVVRRERQYGMEAVVALVSNSMLNALLPTGDGKPLKFAGHLASMVPVYKLKLKRGYEHLPSVTDALMSWHAEDTAVVTGSSSLSGGAGE